MENRRDNKSRAARAPYRAPRLRRFGDVAELTQAVGTKGAGDNSGQLMLKTSL